MNTFTTAINKVVASLAGLLLELIQPAPKTNAQLAQEKAAKLNGVTHAHKTSRAFTAGGLAGSLAV